MIYKSLFTFFAFCLFLTPPKVEVIAWRETVKLSWNEFKAAPKTNTQAVALTASGITFEYSVKETEKDIVDFDTKVEAHFYPKKSWYIKERSNPAILAHEQLHFDITELYARKFRKQISQLKVSNNLKSELQALNQNINRELNLKQTTYDKETNNSMNVELQLQWELQINKELAQLDAYKSKD